MLKHPFGKIGVGDAALGTDGGDVKLARVLTPGEKQMPTLYKLYSDGLIGVYAAAEGPSGITVYA